MNSQALMNDVHKNVSKTLCTYTNHKIPNTPPSIPTQPTFTHYGFNIHKNTLSAQIIIIIGFPTLPTPTKRTPTIQLPPRKSTSPKSFTYNPQPATPFHPQRMALLHIKRFLTILLQNLTPNPRKNLHPKFHRKQRTAVWGIGSKEHMKR